MYVAAISAEFSDALGSGLFFLAAIPFILSSTATNADGFGVFHDEHVEITLAGVKHSIKYSDIVKIKDRLSLLSGLRHSYLIKTVDGAALTIHQGNGLGSKKNLYPLENFILALKKRVPTKVYM